MTTKLVVGNGENGMFLQDFLAGRLDLSRNKAKQIIDSRTVFVNRKRIWMARHSLRSGDRIELPDKDTSYTPSAAVKATILYEDDDYMVVNKPAGILSNGQKSFEERLRKQLNLPSLRAVHRLDKDTSGSFLLAKNQAALERIIPLFQQRAVIKIYEAIVAGQVEPRIQTINTPIDNQPAITHLRVILGNRYASHLQLSIETGRTHQIRKHLLSIDHPVLGDKNYGTRLPASAHTISITRQMLHATSLQFIHPVTSRHIHVNAQPPPDFLSCLRTFRLL
ncbi:MAG: RluA family pseudouridine synthase [Kiritimatiellae bacterium]|nr:RluA family pseudouridine synthase [Kiritimatiellia bacterium]MDD5522148.1 RluA family pseudouridine synthase [Kiritimatiellia bacterium]